MPFEDFLLGVGVGFKRSGVDVSALREETDWVNKLC